MADPKVASRVDARIACARTHEGNTWSLKKVTSGRTPGEFRDQYAHACEGEFLQSLKGLGVTDDRRRQPLISEQYAARARAQFF